MNESNSKIRASIVGGAGYTAGELLRILINHPNVEIASVVSTTQAGQKVSSVHTDLWGDCDLNFTDALAESSDVIFLCLGHGLSREFLANNTVSQQTRVIDLGNDFRLDGVFEGQEHLRFSNRREFIYGLTEVYADEIRNANNIANPGCFATAIQLALLPLTIKGLVTSAVHINAITGSTGAGRSLTETSHFSYRQNNISSYKVFRHQHLDEIQKTLWSIGIGSDFPLNFVPVRGDFTRGIFATLYTESSLSQEELSAIYKDFYEDAPFTHISDSSSLSLKDVVNTNKCLINVQKIDDKVFITSVIDNLLKGASGQAVENMNLMFGLEQTTGLRLKSSGF